MNPAMGFPSHSFGQVMAASTQGDGFASKATLRRCKATLSVRKVTLFARKATVSALHRPAPCHMCQPPGARA